MFEVNAVILLLVTCISFFWFIRRLFSLKTQLKHSQIATKIICDSNSCICCINELLSHSPNVVGIDCEWKSSKNGNNKISLLQIADTNVILLIRLHLISPIPIQLISFLNNVKILKCGVGIAGDKRKLFKDYNIKMSGCIDLNDILLNNNNSYLSLEKMSKLILKKEMKYKNCNINHSEWESNKLSPQQIHYAADDAFIGYLLFEEIMRNHYIKQINDGQTYLEICYGKIDRLSSSSLKNKNKDKNKNKNNSIIIKKDNNLECDKSKIWSRKLTYKRYGYATKILDNNGNILTLCSANLKRYLLQIGKAKIINDVDKYFPDQNKKVDGHNQYVIQLLDSPQIVNINNNNIKDYVRGINVKELECYICGANNNLTRCFLVPKNYPKFINSAKNIHYAVPICLDQCQQNVFKWRSSLEEELINKYKLRDTINNKQLELQKKLRIYALTLQKKRKRYEVSVEIQNKWIQQILTYFNVTDKESLIIKDFHINKEMDIDWYMMNDYNYLIIKDYVNQCVLNDKVNLERDTAVIQLYQLFNGKEIEFIEMWRNDFMTTFKPKCHNQTYETLQIFCTNFNWMS